MTTPCTARAALAGALVFLVLGCGSETKTATADPEETAASELDTTYAVELFNGGGVGPITLRDTRRSGGGDTHCGITTNGGSVYITVAMQDGSWFQADIRPETQEVIPTFGMDITSALHGPIEGFFGSSIACAVDESGSVNFTVPQGE